ncbi:hypothetical protein FDZ73_16525 [bacterium]|nr:MAG: hypothetical protein FDZ73_16525 [bacterium]
MLSLLIEGRKYGEGKASSVKHGRLAQLEAVRTAFLLGSGESGFHHFGPAKENIEQGEWNGPE